MNKIYFIAISILFLGFKSYSQEAILIVSLDITPKNAIVFIDQNQVDVVEGRIELTAGKHQIRILKNGFDQMTDEIKVSRKKTYFKYALVENSSRVYTEDQSTKSSVDNKTVEAFLPTYISVNSYDNVLVKLKYDSAFYKSNEPIKVIKESIDLMVYAPNTDTITRTLYVNEGDSISFDIFPNRKITAKDIRIDMVKVESGDFVMGKPGSKSNARLHKVELDDFYISKYEVTQSLWKMIMKENPSKRIGDSLPVENVSWEDVQAFINKLNQLSGKKYRLPTEAEWEYAARGGHRAGEKQSYSGSTVIDSVAWYWKNSGDKILEGRWDNELMKQNNCRIRKVGQLQANKLGIFDMTGNVWEWCSDWYEEEYYLESPLSNPKGPETGITKVCRGGSYISKASYCRNGFRFSYPPQNSYNYLGFRLVLSD